MIADAGQSKLIRCLKSQQRPGAASAGVPAPSDGDDAARSDLQLPAPFGASTDHYRRQQERNKKHWVHATGVPKSPLVNDRLGTTLKRPGCKCAQSPAQIANTSPMVARNLTTIEVQNASIRYAAERPGQRLLVH